MSMVGWRGRGGTHFAAVGLIVAGVISMPPRAAAEDFDTSLRAFLEHRLASRASPGGIAIGLIDTLGPRFVTCGKLDNDTDASVTPDTIFEIASDTKTFTAVLLADMVERGEMRLDDPISDYLPAMTAVPAFDGQPITLRHLAMHAAGLPRVPDNLNPIHSNNPYADYTAGGLYDFLGRYKLPRAPGAVSEYSTAGMGLLGHLIARKAGVEYEPLVIDRICRPLGMNDTVITLTPEQRERFATGHNSFGETVPPWDLGVLAGAGALRSTARDLTVYVAANLGFTAPRLAGLMCATHQQRLAWFVSASGVISHGGGTAGCASFVGFSPERLRGVVILTNTHGVVETEALGQYLLAANWGEFMRREGNAARGRAYDDYLGQYRRLLTVSDRASIVSAYVLSDGGVAAGAFAAVVCVALVVVWRCARRGSMYRRIGGAAAVVVIPVAAAAAAFQSGALTSVFAPSVGVFREGESLMAARLDGYADSAVFSLPPHAGELMDQGDGYFIERLGASQLHFLRDRSANVTVFEAFQMGGRILFERMSPEPAGAEPPPARRTIVPLDAAMLDKFPGDYDFPPDAISPHGFSVHIWRDGAQLMGRATGEKTIPGAFELFPLAESKFVTKLDEGMEMQFRMNEVGVAKSMVHWQTGMPTCEGVRRAQ